MSGDNAFVGSIPDIYERYLGPMLFETFARDTAARFAGFEGTLLETAAGTGRVTAALVDTTGPGARITATDLNEPMLARAAQIVASPKVAWKQADALALPFGDRAFDAVVCQFGVMFFPDKAAGYREALRVLRPGGRFVFTVWDDLAANTLSHIIQETTAALFPNNPPRFLSRTPFGYHDRDVLRAAVTAAGFAAVEVETVTLETPTASAHDAAFGMCSGSPLRGEIEANGEGALDRAVEACTAALVKAFGEGPIVGRGQAVTITATA